MEGLVALDGSGKRGGGYRAAVDFPRGRSHQGAVTGRGRGPIDGGRTLRGRRLLGVAPLWVMPAAEVALAFAVIVVVHLALNLVGYALGARKTRI